MTHGNAACGIGDVGDCVLAPGRDTQPDRACAELHRAWISPRARVSTVARLGSFGGTSWAKGLSRDGSVVVGWGTTNTNITRAFRVVGSGSLQSLGTLPGGTYSQAQGTNADGSIVLGFGDTPLGTQHAFR